MNDTENTKDKRKTGSTGQEHNSEKVSIQPSETGSTIEESGSPGRTPGKAEGDRETVEQDLREKDKKNAGK